MRLMSFCATATNAPKIAVSAPIQAMTVRLTVDLR